MTHAQTPGPFFTPDSPLKRDFTSDGDGRRVMLMGFVLGRDCRPLADAVVDLWHADAVGAYDNAGYRFRGHQRTDDQGRYVFLTVRPGNYGIRTPHYHVRVGASGRPLLTTQLYFPGELRNAVDFIHDARLEMETDEVEPGIAARFDFIVGDAG